MESVFNRLVKLKDDPEAFNAEADAIFEDFILGVPEDRRKRLRAMHWNIQQQLRSIVDPVARLNKFIEMFYAEYFKLMGDLQVGMEAILEGKPLPQQVVDSSKIVEFKLPTA